MSKGNRSASSTLKGYYYQFDKTIIEILKSDNKSIITVEGIEDIDIEKPTNTIVIQCKYLESEKYNPSLIRKPLIYLLEHFITNTTKTNYYLYAYFGDNRKQFENFDLPSLKELLVYTKDKKKIDYCSQKSITDNQLKEFLKLLTFQEGLKYESQKSELIDLICKELKCTKLEAEELYYNKALRFIYDLAIKKEIKHRKITKNQFIKKINNKAILFNKWFYELKGESEYQKLVKKWIKECDGVNPRKQKLLYIGKDYFTNKIYSVSFNQFVKDLLDKYYSIGKTLSSTKVWTLILDVTKEEMRSIKINLLKEKIIFNDGYEAIQFNSQIFNEAPIINKTPSDKISLVSFYFKIVTEATYKANKKDILKPECVFYFSNNIQEDLFNDDICLIQIQGIKFEDIERLLIS